MVGLWPLYILAESTAIEFSIPFWVLIIAALFLKEKITWKKLVTIIIGFAGVLFIVDPSFHALNKYHFIALMSAISYAITHNITKGLVKRYNSIDIVFIMCLIQTPVAFGLSLPNFVIPTYTDMLWILVVALCALGAHFALTKAIQESDVSNVLSFDYLRLPILLFFGVFLYQEAFDQNHLVGTLLILTATSLMLLGHKIKLRKPANLEKG